MAFRQQQGFILAATLWILAIITAAAGFFFQWTQQGVEQVHQRQQDFQNTLDRHGTQATVLYLLGTQRMTVAGLTLPHVEDPELNQDYARMDWGNISILPIGDEIALDDRPYPGVGSAWFSLQDEGGLLGLNYIEETPLLALLKVLGVPDEQVQPLVAKLQDYIDRDDLHRLNGAEAYHYREQGLPPPPNRELLTAEEVFRVLDWNRYPALWEDRRLSRLTTVAVGGLPNFNTAPRPVLQAIFGGNAEWAELLLQARRHTPLYRLSQIEQLLGVNLAIDPMDAIFLPSNYFRLTLGAKDARRLEEIHIQLTPRADKQAPWLIDYTTTLSPTQEQRDATPDFAKAPIFAAPLSPDPD